MQEDKAIDEISRGEAHNKSKGDLHEDTVTLEHIEDEPAPHLHLKTFLIVAVSA
jgi:hypothetical protein